MMKRTINVTYQDIRCGAIGESDKCPIALAIGRHLQGSKPWVFYGLCTFGTDCNPVKLPYPCEEFARNYDNGGDVEPFSFDIEVPRWLG